MGGNPAFNWAGLTDQLQEVERGSQRPEPSDRTISEDWPMGGCSSAIVAKSFDIIVANLDDNVTNRAWDIVRREASISHPANKE